MNNDVILGLEKKVDEIIGQIVVLREEKEKLEKENHSLKHQLEGVKMEIEGLRSKQKETSRTASRNLDSDGLAIKKRLQKLAGRLAALEDSWN